MSAATTPGAYHGEATGYQEESAGAIFGGTVLATAGLFQFFEGLSAVLQDDLYVRTPNYVYQFDLTTWGWLHLIVGALAIGVGVAVLMGQRWAMVTGIVMATLSLITQFLFIPWQPFWAMIIIGIDIAVVWALANRLSET